MGKKTFNIHIIGKIDPTLVHHNSDNNNNNNNSNNNNKVNLL